MLQIVTKAVKALVKANPSEPEGIIPAIQAGLTTAEFEALKELSVYAILKTTTIGDLVAVAEWENK